FDELKELSKYSGKRGNINRLVKELDDVYNKIFQLTITYQHHHLIQTFILFNHYTIHKKHQYLQISTSPNLNHILNSITTNFTKFQLKQITNFKSTYSKNIFTILKQYKHTPYIKIKIHHFTQPLDIPKS
ncbi:RepB family plasmid replication initiator protein, partial [Staphylococcus epidermidis]|uniref:RepB family plasmid replication initiator protein n=1 Tax=Staphylococcus epidermidis TaxID=1282 RepID=UPI00119D3360